MLMILRELDDATLAEVVRRDAVSSVVDGHPVSVRKEGSSGITGGGGVGDPTGQRALIEKRDADVVAEALAVLTGMMAVGVKVLNKADHARAFLVAPQADKRRRLTTLAGDCGACGRPVLGGHDDPLRSGYCSACHRAWDRAGRPDRSAFEAGRRPG